MNTNSSDGAEVNQDEISGPLSINHSEDNLNIISATVGKYTNFLLTLLLLKKICRLAAVTSVLSF